MAILDLIEWSDPIGNELVYRVPGRGSGEFRLGSQCVVREGQMAVFARDGITADILSPGRHTLTTLNIPLLGRLIGAPFGGRSPFRAEVYYTSTRLFTDLKWGTTQPIMVRDPQLGPVRLRAFGAYAIEVRNPLLLISRLVAARGLYTTGDIEDYLRTMILQGMADLVAEYIQQQRMSVIDLASQYNELSALAADALHEPFADLGLLLRSLYITAITLPEAVEQRLDAATGVSLFGGVDGYTRYKAAEALGNVGGGDVATAVVGIGLGTGLSTLVGQHLHGAWAPAAGTTCTNCRVGLMPGARFCSACGTEQRAATPQCAQCKSELVHGARFCSTCGTAA